MGYNNNSFTRKKLYTFITQHITYAIYVNFLVYKIAFDLN